MAIRLTQEVLEILAVTIPAVRCTQEVLEIIGNLSEPENPGSQRQPIVTIA
jgi:hypothetical protein